MLHSYDVLMKKIESLDLVVGVIGLGYIGLPLSISFCEQQIKVLGFDINQKKLNLLLENKSYVKNVSDERLKAAQHFFKVTNEFELINNCDVIIICVPTPLNKHREPNLEFIQKAMSSILPNLKSGQLISLESTTYPGTTEELIATPLTRLGHRIGEDFFVIYSPEREDPGRIDFNTKTTPKICGGVTSHCLQLGQKLYETIVDQVVPVSSTKTAEMTKLLENIHRSVNIGLVNEMKMIADKMGIDIHEVIKAASSKPFGFVPYEPGPGLGGHCIPVDPFYLSWKAKEFGIHTYFIELAGEINSSMPSYVIEKLISALNDRKMPANGSRVLVLGVAYKKNVDDLRESPALEIIKLLRQKKIVVDYSDPFVDQISLIRDYAFEMQSVSLNKDVLENYDAVIMVTDHDIFDYKSILTNARLIIDTRGRFDNGPKIVKA